MAKETVSIDLDASPDAAWAVVGDFHGIADWFPGIESNRPDGDVRVLSMGTMEIREQLVERNEAACTLVYSIVGGVPLERHRATVTVSPREGGSHVDWAVDIEPDAMLPIMTDTYQKALEALQAKLS